MEMFLTIVALIVCSMGFFFYGKHIGDKKGKERNINELTIKWGSFESKLGEYEKLKQQQTDFHNLRRLFSAFLYDFSQNIRDDNLDSYQKHKPQADALYKLSLLLRSSTPNESLGEIFELKLELEKLGLSDVIIDPFVAWYQFLCNDWKTSMLNTNERWKLNHIIDFNVMKNEFVNENGNDAWRFERIQN